MNEILFLILAWLPIPVEATFLVIIFKILIKKVSDSVSVPEKQLKATKELDAKIGYLSREITHLAEVNENLHKDNIALKMQLRGHKHYGEEQVKKN